MSWYIAVAEYLPWSSCSRGLTYLPYLARLDVESRDWMDWIGFGRQGGL